MASRIQYILAKSLKEAHRFAQDVLGLSRGHYQVVNSPSTLSSVRNADLHLVPGWDNRFDKFAMRGALKWTRMNVIKHEAQEPAPQQTTEPHIEAQPDGLNPPGEQFMISISPLEASDLVADAQAGDPETQVTDDPFATPAQTEDEAPSVDTPVSMPPVAQVITNLEDIKSKRTRRRRCPECNDLFPKEEFDSHVASHSEQG